MATLFKRVTMFDQVHEYLIKSDRQKYFNGNRGLWIKSYCPDPERQ